MTDLQASIDFSIELGTLTNVDLFQKGYYQVRVGLKTFSGRVPLKVTCHEPKRPESHTSVSTVRNSAILQGIAVSQTVQVMYKNEELLLNDVFKFTVQMLLDINKLEESVVKAGLKLIVELWFAEDLNEQEDTMEVACSRVFHVNFTPTMGLHTHLPVLFDYFHLCAVTLTVHASLIALHQPIYNPKNPAASWPLRGGQMSTLGSALFNAAVPTHAYSHISKGALRSANYMYKTICKLLLSAHESLQNEIKRMAKKTLHTKRPIAEPEYRDCHTLLDTMCKEAESVKLEDDFLLNATSKIAHLCAYNVVLWQDFTETVTHNNRVKMVLAKEYHQSRVKRFSEAFFTQEWSKNSCLSCYEPSVNGHNDLTSVVRGSAYFNHPQPLPLTCIEIDGNQTNTPIIFEDIYKDDTMPATIIVTSLAAEKPTNSTWDITSLDSAESALSPDSSPPVKTKSSSRNNQLIKNTMPAVLNRPTKAYSMKEEDLNKREEKEKNSACPELLGFKRLTIDLSEVEPYEIGSLSPSNERTSGLKRRKSLLMPERRRLKDKLDTASLGSDYATSDNFSLPADEPVLDFSDRSSGSSTGSAVAVKDVNMSPKSEKSYKLANGVSKKVSSPAFTRRNSRRKKKIAATNSVGLNSSAKAAPPDQQQQQQTLQVTHNRIVASRSEPRISSVGQFLVQPVTDTVIDFLTNKEDLKAKLAYQGHLCSDFATLASEVPYFWRTSNSPRGGLHLVICVHGLDGNRQDLRLVKHYLEMALPNERFEFLMSGVNEEDTFLDFKSMGEKLAEEIVEYIDCYCLQPTKVSFIAHSLGNIIVRTALTMPRLLALIKPHLYTYLSLSGPHLGTTYSDSGLVNMGMWVIQKLKKSESLMQLGMKDHSDPKSTFMYKLSEEPGLEFFKHVLLVSSMQDKYVPYHSARIELCKSATKDNSSTGRSYRNMVNNLLQPLLKNPSLTFIRYDTFYTFPTNTNSVIGRAAHIAVLDSEIFIEKFFLVSACKYFR